MGLRANRSGQKTAVVLAHFLGDEFVQQRVQGFISNADFERRVSEFVSGRLDDLSRSNATFAETVTPDTIAFIKGRIDQEVPPINRHRAH